VLEPDAMFCSRCGLNLTKEYRATPIGNVAPDEASDTFIRLRESIGTRYGIERELGRGGMATVFLAQDLKHEREVAIKVLHPDLAATIGGERFEREIKLAAKLQHPHILGLYDSGNADGLLYYVMPFVKGESLRDRLDREGMLPVEDAIRITLEVCSALGHAHEKGIVHRDIKPENILLAGEHALVADFGIARAATEAGQQKLTQTGMAVGTPVYMAPEQSSGEAVGPPADLYSLGCVLFEMLAGEPPFNGANAMAIMARHLMEQPPSIRVVRSVVPEEIEQAIFIALNKAPVDRPQTAQQFAELLAGMFGATSTMRVMRGTQTRRLSSLMTAQDLLPPPPPVPWWKKPVAIAAVAGVALLAAGGAWLAAKSGGAPTVNVLGDEARRVAVLHFADMSRDSSLGPIADGLTGGLIQTLSTSPSITVISRDGIEPYRGSSVGPDSIARALRVGFLVRGEVEPDRDRVRVSVRLDDASGARYGSGSFTVPRDSVLALQDSLGRIASDLIRGQLGQEIRLQTQRAATSSTEAWVLAQRALQQQRLGQQLTQRGDAAGGARALELADSLLAVAEGLDAKWADPPAMRAGVAYARSRLVGGEPTLIKPLVETGIAHADRALARDPSNADALEIRGTLRFWGWLMVPDADSRRKEQAVLAAQADLERATQINKMQAGAFSTLAAVYAQVPGKTSNDIYLAAVRAFEADEFLATANLNFARAFNATYDLGNTAAAQEWSARYRSRFPNEVRAIRSELYLMTMPAAQNNDIARAWQLVDTIVARTTPGDSARTRLWMRILAAGAIARNAPAIPALADSARRVVARSTGDAVIDPARELPYFGAFVLTILGDGEGAVRLLGEYVAANPLRASALRDDPGWWFRSIAERPDFRRLVESVR
jgi:eukaryotic-like serine/threonine-protein kinase